MTEKVNGIAVSELEFCQVIITEAAENIWRNVNYKQEKEDSGGYIGHLGNQKNCGSRSSQAN